MPGEHFAELNALVRAIASAMALPEAEVIAAFEANSATIAFETAADGTKVIDVGIGDRSCRIAAGRSDAP
jgi:hypothetical protein